MKNKLFFLLFTTMTRVSLGQLSYETKEIKIQFSNAVEVFNICLKNPTINYDDKKEYFWYTEFSGIKSTKGGTGGNLLHGNYKLYNKRGDLVNDKNYFLGLRNGTFKTWDSVGNIKQLEKWENNNPVYLKYLEDGKWVEESGDFYNKGWIKKVTTQWGVLIEETIGLGLFDKHTRIYYDVSGKIKLDCFSKIGGKLYGKCIHYYENGRIELDSEFCEDSPIEIRTGNWKWYNEDGSLKTEEKYKAEVVKWENGEFKYAGGYIFDNEKNLWSKTGEWCWFTESGKFESSKNYEWGEEVKK
jgi:antitoxin component YwqK of YwqJK toxin-antitoxin module